MILFPPAKLNLGLRIINKREDGYHNLETLFLPIPLCDLLEILPLNKQLVEEDKDRPAQPTRCHTTEEGDLFIESGILTEGKVENNTILKLLRLLRSEGYAIPPLYIELFKKIPFGAGLGGGSADATFAFRAIHSLFSLPLSHEKSLTLLAKVGSDCPFFLYDTPMLAQGKGEVLESFSLSKEVLNSYLTLVKPPLAISTAEAYRAVPKYPQARGSLQKALQQPILTWKNHIKNDFEESLFPQYSRLSEIKEYLYLQGATFALMSGSGSTLFALSRQPLALSHETHLLKDCFIWQGAVQSPS